MAKLLSIALGGALGALLRYGVSGFTFRYAAPGFPWGTLVVNLSGCLAIGFLWGISERVIVSPYYKPFLLVGVLGAYTTFSTFGLETFHLMRDREIRMLLMNILASNILGIVLVIAGFMLSRSVARG